MKFYNNYGFNWEVHRSHRVIMICPETVISVICLETVIGVKYMNQNTFWCHQRQNCIQGLCHVCISFYTSVYMYL